MPTNPNVRRVPYSRLTWNPAACRYISPRGTFISQDAVWKILDEDNAATGERMQAHGAKLKDAAQKFRDGALTQDAYDGAVTAWRDNMAADMKAMHLGNGAQAAGGFHNMDSAHYGRIGQRLRVQYAYLSNFAIEAAGNPDVVLSLDSTKRAFEDRIDAYAKAGRGTFAAVNREEHKRSGFQSVENVPEPNAHHCKGPNSCPEMTELGRVAIDDPRYLVTGFRVCGPHCKCGDKYSMEPVKV